MGRGEGVICGGIGRGWTSIHSAAFSQVPNWTLWETVSAAIFAPFLLLPVGWGVVHRTPETEIPTPFFTAFLP